MAQKWTVWYNWENTLCVIFFILYFLIFILCYNFKLIRNRNSTIWQFSMFHKIKVGKLSIWDSSCLPQPPCWDYKHMQPWLAPSIQLNVHSETNLAKKIKYLMKKCDFVVPLWLHTYFYWSNWFCSRWKCTDWWIQNTTVQTGYMFQRERTPFIGLTIGSEVGAYRDH